MLLFLCSTEHSPLSGLLRTLLAQSLPAALAPPRRHSCPGSLWLSCPLQVWSGSELCSPLGSISPGVLAWAKQPLLGRAPGLMHHPELPLLSSPRGQYKRRAGTRALFMHCWPRNTAEQVLEGKDYTCHRYLSYFGKYPTVPHTSSPSFVCGQYQCSFFRKQGLLGLLFLLLLSAAL